MIKAKGSPLMRVARLLGSEGLLVGITHTPSMRT
jgi:hypothetical protein